MKLRFIYVVFFAAFALILLQSKQNGPASQGIGDYTGSPLSGGGECISCHSGGLFNSAITVRVKNTGGTIVTSYIPGASYTIEFAVTSSFGAMYGFQGVALRGANLQAGTFGAPISTNTQVSSFNSRQYAEHSSPAIGAGGFTFIVPWTAPAIGSGNVTIYADGMTVNGNSSTNGDDPAGAISLVLTETTSASINYANSSYCSSTSDPTPTITGTTGGTFSATPAGLSINPTTGTIDLSASTANQTYTITYTYPGGTATDVVTINPVDDASFSYAQTSYCNSGLDPTPTITGLSGGSFLSVPSGLSINSTTGTIDVSASALGTYTVGYQTNGPCPDIGTFSVTITNLDNASFAYANGSYCQNGIDPTPTASTSGGTYSSTSGLAIASGTGVIDLSASTAGVYTVTYTTAGGCSNTSTQTVNITAMDDASFAYASNSYCQNVPDPTPNISGLPNGFFTVTPSGLSIDSWTGIVDVSASAVDIYTITYTTNGACPNSSSQTFTIEAADDASFTYGASSFCQNGANVTPTFSSSGVWSSTPSGLSIDTLTGIITAASSTPNTYTITHTTTGSCSSSFNQFITITAPDDASFNYGGTSFCQSEPNITPTVATTGSWSVTPNGLTINSTSGMINPSTSTTGVYNISYTTNGACPSSSNMNISILAQDIAAFDFEDTTICFSTAPMILAVSGTTSGIYTVNNPDLVFLNNTTGQIDLQNSSLGLYVITYTSNGACPAVDSITVEYSICGNISKITQNELYKLYPNPNQGTFIIENNNSAGYTNILVRDVLGQVVYNQELFIESKALTNVDIPMLSKGVYWVEIQKNASKQTLKMVVSE